MKAITGKQYRHYKGQVYTVLTIARSEADPTTELVIYRAEYDSPDFGDRCVWVRERGNWEGTLTIDGEVRERFALLETGV